MSSSRRGSVAGEPINTSTGVLNLNWTFGINHESNGVIHSLSDGRQKILFYAAGHTGVLFDWTANRQKLMQGHSNYITSTFISRERKWVGTADSGPNSMIIIWDIRPSGRNNDSFANGHAGTDGINTVPIKTIFHSHQGAGVLAVEFTPDSKYLVSLGANSPQSIAIWDWTTNSNEPICEVVVTGEPQTWLKINSNQPNEMITNGPNNVNFFVWDGQKSIQQHTPILSSKDFKHSVSGFKCSTFLPHSGEAITATNDGDVVVWVDHSLSNLSVKLEPGEKAAIKFVKLHNSAINYIACINDQFIVTGGEDGIVKVFDLNFRILFWHEKMNSGPIAAVVFSPSSELMFQDLGIPELIVATKHARVLMLHNPAVSVRPGSVGNASVAFSMGSPSMAGNNKKELTAGGMPAMTTVFTGQYGALTSLISHPTEHKFLVGSDAGLLQVWDYENKSVLQSRVFDEPAHDAPVKAKDDIDTRKKVPVIPMKIECLAYSASGKTIGVGFSNGVVRFLDSEKLEDLAQSYLLHNEQHGHQVSTAAIKKIAFSNEGDYCAVADGLHVVSILKKQQVKVKSNVDDLHEKRLSVANTAVYKSIIDGDEPEEDPVKSARQRIEWVLIGRAKTHYKAVLAFIFSPQQADADAPCLYSVSKDRHVADYNLSASNVSGGVVVNSIRRIEQIYRPEAAISLNKQHTVHPEQFILTFNSGFKFRTYTAENQLCRKTTLGPTFGGAINHLSVIPDQGEVKYVAYSTGAQTIGIIKLPLDGNPFKTMGVIGHPGEVSAIAPTHNGSHVVSAGLKDGIVNLWSLNLASLEAQIQLGGEGLEPFYNMLDPSGLGEQSPIYREFEDYFYYAQLKSQGETRSRDRLTSDTVPLSEVPSIMQAMGFYLSNLEMDDLVNEVKYSRFAEGRGEEVNHVTFGDLIKLFLNHRPVQDVTVSDIEIALSHAKRLEPGQPIPTGPVTRVKPSDSVQVTGLTSILQQFGEAMSADDVDEAFFHLLQEHPTYKGSLPPKFTSQEFIENILSFQYNQE